MCTVSESVQRRNGRFVTGQQVTQLDLHHWRHQAVVGRPLVVVEDDVEIGANTTVDRGANRDTVIGEGTKIVLTGDIGQIDSPYLDSSSNGLSHVIERMKAHPIAGHVTLDRTERSELASIAAELL